MMQKILTGLRFRRYASGKRGDLQYIGSMSKDHGKIKNYRVIKEKGGHVLYVR